MYYMYMYMYCTCTYLFVYVHVHIDMYMYIHVCICTCISTYTCTYTCTCICTYTCTYTYMYIRAGMKVGMFELSFVCCAFEAKFLPLKLAATPTLMFAHVHVYNLNVWLIMWACSRKVEAVLLADFVLFLSPAMPNLDRNTDRNNTSTRYKAIIQFWRLSIAS